MGLGEPPLSLNWGLLQISYSYGTKFVHILRLWAKADLRVSFADGHLKGEGHPRSQPLRDSLRRSFLVAIPVVSVSPGSNLLVGTAELL